MNQNITRTPVEKNMFFKENDSSDILSYFLNNSDWKVLGFVPKS